MNRFIKMHEKDIVATSLVYLKSGDIAEIYSSDNVKCGTIQAIDNIPYGNKIAIRDIIKGEKVVKYGAAIGECTQNIYKGELVHVHNVRSLIVDIPLSNKKEIMRQMNICPRKE